MRLIPDNRGVSLALTIGLLLLLVTVTTTINELVIRALRASHRIESADKAYFAAEAGIEDALYELSSHSAGYQTPALTNANVRSDRFDDDLTWVSDWEIESRSSSTCDSVDPWPFAIFTPDLCGKIYENQKLVFNLYNDDAVDASVPESGVGSATAPVNLLEVTSIEIRFRLPPDIVAANDPAFVMPLPLLNIDNDRDYIPGGGGLNEDGEAAFGYPLNPCPYSGGVKVSDNDCDTLQDEDSPEDPVLLWKLTDNKGHVFSPLRGCKSGLVPEPRHASHPLNDNAILCEKSFIKDGFQLYATITDADHGLDENGTIIALSDFMDNVYADDPNSPLQLEILPVIPFQFVNEVTDEKVYFPYIEYAIDYLATDAIPSPYFTVKSDGYFQSFKQSISTNVIPQSTTRLLDLTIIQQ